VVVEVLLMDHLPVHLVDQVVVVLTTNQETLELQTKDMLVQMLILILTQVVVVLVLLLSKPQGHQDHKRVLDMVE
tara:strand:- start:340 stop:564 length:225 start_codon:yes stop_codon:yes gene_type:complete